MEIGRFLIGSTQVSQIQIGEIRIKGAASSGLTSGGRLAAQSVTGHSKEGPSKTSRPTGQDGILVSKDARNLTIAALVGVSPAQVGIASLGPIPWLAHSVKPANPACSAPGSAYPK